MLGLTVRSDIVANGVNIRCIEFVDGRDLGHKTDIRMGRLDLLFCFSKRAFVTLPFGVWGLIPWSLGKTTQLPKNYMKNKNPNECDVASDECIMHCAVLCRLVALVSAFKVASIILIKKKNHTEILVDRHRILLGCQNRGLDTFFDFFLTSRTVNRLT